MGAANVSSAFARWAHLPHVPFRLLVFMSLVSKDADNPPRYWGGRYDLACTGLGRTMLPPETDDSDSARRDRDKAYEAVRVAMKLLEDAGAIRRVQVGHDRHGAPVYAHTGRRVTYELSVGKALVQPGPSHRDKPGPKALVQPGEGPGSARGEALVQPGPEEEVGTRRNTTGRHLSRSSTSSPALWPRAEDDLCHDHVRRDVDGHETFETKRACARCRDLRPAASW